MTLAFLLCKIGVSIDEPPSLLAVFCRLELSKSQADSLLNQLAQLWKQEFDSLCRIAWASRQQDGPLGESGRERKVMGREDRLYALNSRWRECLSEGRLRMWGSS